MRPSELQASLLRHEPDILHFSGHGIASGELIFQDEQGCSQPVSADAMAQLLAVLGRRIRCVVLNACFSHAQADAMRRHVDCVVGMWRGVPEAAAIAFASSFYRALGHGKSLGSAFELGVNQIALIGQAGADQPVLLVRDGVDAEALQLRRS